jgi:hypothetical protein
MPAFQECLKILKIVGILVAAILATLLLLPLILESIGGAAYSYSYPYFFRILTCEGGINAWLARAISVLFAVAIAKGAPMVFSLTSERRRTAGWAVLLSTWVAFNLLVFACTRSACDAGDEKIISPDGSVTSYYCIAADGDWKLFRHPGYTPNGKNYSPMGEELKPMTPEAAREFNLWKREKDTRDRQKAAEGEKQARAEAERRFRETYVNDTVVSSVASADRVILAFKNDPSGSQGDALQGLVASVLARKNKRPVSGAFKSPFYTNGLFDDLWNGDQSVLERLNLLDGAPGCFLLCKTSLAAAAKTDYEGLVSVQGTVSIIVVKTDGRTGPSVFKASGAGGDEATATANCVKRLVDAIDWDVVFPRP